LNSRLNSVKYCKINIFKIDQNYEAIFIMIHSDEISSKQIIYLLKFCYINILRFESNYLNKTYTISILMVLVII
jgi:hypothetical protein